MSKAQENATELPEDIEIVGPGQILAEAREKIGLSAQQVADKLNFRLTLVKAIEEDCFERSLPATFNRGYLKNYAKLVHASEEDVLASYEMISVAEKQGAEMQSFSKQTEKQAENNRLMWVSYLILAVLIGSTLMWWLQDNKTSSVNNKVVEAATDPVKVNEAINTTEKVIAAPESQLSAIDENSEDNLTALADTLIQTNNSSSNSEEYSGENTLTPETKKLEPSVIQAETPISASAEFAASEQTFLPTEVSFTFIGDCWVNIYDATGERIAWGIKKSGYEMNISGQAPFSITLGKPELVTIVYDGATVDMSQFNRGNIAKFTLPLE
ncbi:MAG: RodZ domain-containing protein [Thalassotalea sp.]